jgi:ABC-type glycerol-3-phosphate transport system substrate-binding protein
MNKFLISAVSVTALTLGACASQPSSSDAEVAAVQNMTNAERYRAAVNSYARAKNVEVKWVNPPDEDDLDEYVDEAPASAATRDVERSR